MKLSVYALPAVLLLTCGCATYAQMFVNASGQVMQCSATGQGLVGMATAKNASSKCSENMRSAGYLEIERAGVVGMYTTANRGGDTLRILKVMASSPAEQAGLRPGDRLCTVDGQRVSNESDAAVLLFGEAGTSVELVVERDGNELHKVIRRAPYSAVFGQQPAPADQSRLTRRGMKR